ncbi:MAG: hypothetical protein JWQ02_1885 [Capsulimonas sp.]|jgi:hypothetical protein|nr:hypothetical protein [Capsulimonas sp.]
MDIWTSVNWDVLFGYALHDCSCVALTASALLVALAACGRFGMKRS